jgi:outer membrane receptor protein involved in Fe transport
VLAEGPIVKDKSSFVFSARRSFLDWVISSTGMTAVPEYHNLQTKVDINLSPRHHLSLDGVYGHDYVKVEENEDVGGYGGGNANRVDDRGDQIITGGTISSLWGTKGISYLTLSQVQSHWDQDVIFDVTNRFLNHSTESETSLKLEMNWAFNQRHEISAGVEGKYVHFDINRSIGADTIYYWDTNFANAHDDTIIGIFRTYAPWIGYGDVNSYKTAAYVQYTLKPLSRVTLRTGLRWDYFDYTGAQNLSPRVSLSFLVAPKTTVNIAYGEHTQTPSYEELTRNLANRDLENKLTRHVVVGIEQQLRPDTKASLEVYYKDYRHVPIELSSTTADPYDDYNGRLVNQGKGDSRGVEFFLQKKFSQNYHATLSYAYYRARAVDPRNGTYYDWDYDYRHVLTLIGGYRIRFGQKFWYQRLRAKWWYHATAWALPLADELEIGIRWRYLGGRPYTAPIYHRELHTWVVEPDQGWNTNRFPPYHRLDLRIDRRFFFNRWNLVTYFDIMNVYGRDNIWDYSRNEYGEVEKELQWQVFPVGGLVVEF